MSLLLLFHGSGAATAPATPAAVHVRELAPLRLHIDAVAPSGRHFRWGTDEPNAENVFADARNSSAMPGGWADADVTLPRKPGVDYSDLKRLSTIRFLGAGGAVAGEYRLERAPRVSGEKMSVNPGCVGWQAHLEDDKSAAEVYRDIELSKWGEPSRQRKANLLGSGVKFMGSASVVPDQTSGIAALVMQSTELPGGAGADAYVEAWYDANGIALESVYYDAVNYDNTTLNGMGSADWSEAVLLSTDDVHSSTTATADLLPNPDTGTLSTSATDRVFATLQWVWEGASAAGPGTWEVHWRRLAVYGNHGLTKRGSEPDAGFWASDVVAHAVRTWAPLLGFTEGSDGTVRPSGFVIPQLAFLDRTTAAEIVKQATRFGLQDWGVWENKEFFWHERGARNRKWRARVGPAKLSETGPQVDRLWNGVLVQYQDVDGTTKTVGPEGSGANTEDDVLEDTDPLNPANELGIRRWDLLQMQGVSTVAGATEVGRRFLEQARLLDRSGQAEIVGFVESDRGVLHPYWRVRAGDEISFVDSNDTSYRRIVKVDSNHSARSCQIDLDAPPEGLAELLERLQVVLVPLGL